MRRLFFVATLLVSVLAPDAARAQLLETRAISLEAARRIADAAEAEARRNQWTVAVAVVDAAGELILFHRLDGTQPASLDIALGKARTAARFKRPTKLLEDAVAAGRTALVTLPDILPLEGGLPVVVDGQVVGAVGVSGATAQQDAQVARAGIGTLPGATWDRP